MEAFPRGKKKGLFKFTAISLILAFILMISPVDAMALSITDLASRLSTKEKTVMVFILDNDTYTANGEMIKMDVSPTIVESRTMLPIRYAATPLGADVGWDDATRKVTVSLESTKLELWIGQSNALLNGQSVAIDPDNANVKPLIINDRTMLPLRFVTEALGCDVDWDDVNRKVTITGSGSATKPILPVKPVTPPVTIEPGSILSPDISMIKGTWGMEQKGQAYTVAVTEANLPIVQRTGCGYNVFDKYASADSIKQAVLDIEKLVIDQRVKRVFLDEFTSISSEGRTIQEYSESMTINAKAGGSFMGFGGSVKTNFSSGHTSKTDQYFATHSRVKKLYDVYITTPTAANLKPYLTTQARYWLNDVNTSPAAVFGEFGHYVLVDSVTGGRLDVNITANAQAASSFENFSVAAKAEFNVLVASASASGEYSKITNRQSYQDNRELTFYKYGGAPIYENQLSDPQAMANWENSLLDQGTMVDFGNKTSDALIPIWDFCDDKDRKDQLKAAFEKLNSAEKAKWPMNKYVTNIAFVSAGDQFSAQKLCPPNYKLINVNLNHGVGGDYIYLCYKLGENIDAAYTDLFMEFADKGEPRPQVEQDMNHNGNYLKYTRIPQDLTSGLDEKLAYQWYIYLWVSRDKKLPPIKEIDVVTGSTIGTHPGWQSVCWQNTDEPANTNKGSVIQSPVYIMFRR